MTGLSKFFVKKTIAVKYGLEYQELDERKNAFVARVIKVVAEMEIYSTYDYQYFLHIMAEGSELEQLAFNQDCSYAELFTQAKSNFEYFLYLFSRLISAYNNYHEVDDVKEYVMKNLKLLMNMFTDQSFEYTYDSESVLFIRKLDEATESVISTNIEMITQNENEENKKQYLQCVDDFLKITNKGSSTEYYANLKQLRDVFERSLSLKEKQGKSGESKIVKGHETKTIVNMLFSKTEGDVVEIPMKALEFINKNVHHDQKDGSRAAKPYNFSKQEYLYWWLEINKYIYLLGTR